VRSGACPYRGQQGNQRCCDEPSPKHSASSRNPRGWHGHVLM